MPTIIPDEDFERLMHAHPKEILLKEEIKRRATTLADFIREEIKLCDEFVESDRYGMSSCKWGMCGYCGVPKLLWKWKTGEIHTKLTNREIIEKLKGD